MLGLPDLDNDPTTGWADASTDPIEAARERGRRKAVDVIVGTDDELAATADGGLSIDAIRWAEANPNVDPEAVAKYDENTRPYRETDRTVELPPRGEPGDPTNRDRFVVLAEAKAALREYRELENRTG
jgi:hypothetical protein